MLKDDEKVECDKQLDPRLHFWRVHGPFPVIVSYPRPIRGVAAGTR